MRVEHYIVELLYRHNCIVVPDFGAFLANSRPAQTNIDSHWIAPPIKSLTFNQQLTKNDGLLVSYIANAKNLAYDDMLNEVLECSKTWKKHLKKGEKLFLFGIGALQLSKDNTILFTPEDRTNYLPSSFGLAPVTAIPLQRERFIEEVAELEGQSPLMIATPKRESGYFRPFLKYTAVFFLMMSLGSSAYLGYTRHESSQLLVEDAAQKKVDKTIQQATFFDGAPITLPAFTLNVTQNEKPKGPRYYVIAGAFRIKENADRKIVQLKRQNFDAEYVGVNKFQLHQVAFSSFDSKNKALQYLNQIQRNVSADAWLLSVK